MKKKQLIFIIVLLIFCTCITQKKNTNYKNILVLSLIERDNYQINDTFLTYHRSISIEKVEKILRNKVSKILPSEYPSALMSNYYFKHLKLEAKSIIEKNSIHILGFSYNDKEGGFFSVNKRSKVKLKILDTEITNKCTHESIKQNETLKTYIIYEGANEWNKNSIMILTPNFSVTFYFNYDGTLRTLDVFL